MKWHAGEWTVFELSIVQIKEIRDDNIVYVSDGYFETSGRLLDRLRPLTLSNKRTVEWFDYYYNQLRKIDGEADFNYPDIHRYFASAALKAIDEEGNKTIFDRAIEFVHDAGKYVPVIQGVNLFRRKRA